MTIIFQQSPEISQQPPFIIHKPFCSMYDYDKLESICRKCLSLKHNKQLNLLFKSNLT